MYRDSSRFSSRDRWRKVLLYCVPVILAGMAIVGVAWVSRSEAGVGSRAGGERIEGLSGAQSDDSFPALNSPWRTDPIWYDGKAEYAEYDAVRRIYGKARRFDAVMITNKQRMDPSTTTKAVDWRQPETIEVFKLNVRQVIATENYDYKFLTTSFIRTADLSPFKMTVSSQEDCGATFKHFVVGPERIVADQFIYFPDGGPRHVELARPAALQFVDSLSLVLRDFPFEARMGGAAIELPAIPDQTDTRERSVAPVALRVMSAGVDELDLPIGKVRAYRLEVTASAAGSSYDATYWFAADGGPEWLHIMVKMKRSDGIEFALRSNRRWAYWER